MVSSSVSDVKRSNLQAILSSTVQNITDLEWSYYSANSGLTPPSHYSITDHKRAYYISKGAVGGTLDALEASYFKAQGAIGNDLDDLRLDFFKNHGFALPAVTYNDSFVRANAGNLGSVGGKVYQYKNFSGASAWSINANRAMSPIAGDGTETSIAFIDTGSNKADIQATLTGRDFSAQYGVAAAFDGAFTDGVNPTNAIAILALAAGGSYNLAKWVNGVLASTNLVGSPAAAPGDIVRLVVDGTNWTAYINGTQYGTGLFTPVSGGTKHGLIAKPSAQTYHNNLILIS